MEETAGGRRRPLSTREREVLVAIVTHGTTDDDPPLADGDRQRWLAQVPDIRVVGRCGCGTCPSVQLGRKGVERAGSWETRVVLQGDTDGAVLLLFVDDDQLSDLELAPYQDQSFDEFPDAEQIRFPS